MDDSKTPKRQARGKRARQTFTASLSERNDSARQRALNALSAMWRGSTLSRAARENGVSPRTIKRYAGAALLQDRPGGQIRARKNDRLVRYLQIPGPHGPIDITTHGSEEATEAAKYKAAVNRFLRGEPNALAPWRGKKIAGVELITDVRTLKNLAQKELLPYSLYRSFSGGAA